MTTRCWHVVDMPYLVVQTRTELSRRLVATIQGVHPSAQFFGPDSPDIRSAFYPAHVVLVVDLAPS